MMRHKVLFYPLYMETLVVVGTSYDHVENGADYTRHYTLKTPQAAQWSVSHLMRELADRLEGDEP